MLRRSHSSVQQLEIQLHGNSGKDDNILMLKGPPLEAGSTSLKGQIVLSALDNMAVKKITLKLNSSLRMRWADPNVPKAASQLPLRYEKQLYSQEYSGFEIPGRLSTSNPTSQKATPASSLTNLASYFGSHKHHHRGGSNEASPSGSPAGLSNLNRAQSSVNLSHQVSAGSYKFPFEMVIPGDINESIEGNNYVQLSYWLQATVERGRMQQNISTKKHIRVVRTIGVDSYDVAHTVSIDNTWPKKVEYKITVPCKAAPIGSQLEVQFAMVPLDKGLKLGRIRTEIVEYVSLATPVSQPKEEEHIVASQLFETPPNFDHFSDEWELMKMIDLPRSLSRCTQDATIPPYAKINHKFRCFISLVNRDGHTSELRASLPITLYISPNVYLLGELTDGTSSSSKHSKHSQPTERPIFNVERTRRSGQTTPNGFGSEDGAAPPTYSHHTLDRLYSTVATPAESPLESGAVTPRFSPNDTHNAMSLANLDPSQQAQLAAGLRALALSRQNSQQNVNQSGTGSNSVSALSRVPSYAEALNERASGEAAPDYTD